jgi:hypothetical protein
VLCSSKPTAWLASICLNLRWKPTDDKLAIADSHGEIQVWNVDDLLAQATCEVLFIRFDEDLYQ